MSLQYILCFIIPHKPTAPSSSAATQPPVTEKQSRTILISNIPRAETVESIINYFSHFGKIESSKHYKPPETHPFSLWHMTILFDNILSAEAAASVRHKSAQVRLATSGPNKPKRNELVMEPKVEQEEEDCFDAAYAHAFENYRPAHYHNGFQHPGHLVESTALSYATPPEIHYQLSLPEYVCPHIFFSDSSIGN